MPPPDTAERYDDSDGSDDDGGLRQVDVRPQPAPWDTGDAAASEAAFAAASHVSRLRLEHNRVVIAFMEPRAAVAEWDQEKECYTLRVGCQSAHGMRGGLAAVLGVDEAKVRVVVPDTGGGFGARGAVYPEFVVALLASRLLCRAVKWTESRSEAFLADCACAATGDMGLTWVVVPFG